VFRRRRLVGTACYPAIKQTLPPGDAEWVCLRNDLQDAVTLKFLIDDNTKIDGKLVVGSMAAVDYRTEDVNNIAVHVVVQPARTSQ
jgi:hypothetical protein